MSDPLLSPHRRAPLIELAASAVVELVLAAWLVASPAALTDETAAFVANSRITAGALGTAAIAALLLRRRAPLWIAGAAGLWLASSPAAIDVGGTGATASAILTGALAALEGLVYPLAGALGARPRTRSRARPPRGRPRRARPRYPARFRPPTTAATATEPR